MKGITGDLFNLIISDIMEVSVNLPYAFITGILFLAICLSYFKIRHFSIERKLLFKAFAVALFAVYFHMLLYIVYFSREDGSRDGINMVLLGTWGNTLQDHAWVIENVILFIPFGLLLPCIMNKRKYLVIFMGCVCSICIEIFQLKTGRGYCQLDDIVMNTAGAVLGYVGYKAFDKLIVLKR